MYKLVLEIVACSAEDAVEAERRGANRLELCAAIELGGLTPSIGLLEQTLAATSVPIMAMIRPRAGGFRYSEQEIETMCRDAEAFAKAGVHGLVFGVLTGDNHIDVAACSRIRQAAPDCEAVFHRAFDQMSDPFEGLDQLVSIHFTRIMTAGQAKTAEEGLPTLKKLAEHGSGRIEIMPGGSIRPDNVKRIIAELQPRSVHEAPLQNLDKDAYAGQFASALDPEGVSAIRRAIDS